MKNNLEFYQHDADSDRHPKFKMLRVQFGWAGDGKFWALNNRIANAENCCLDLNKKYIKATVASDLDFNMEEFDKFIECLIVDCELIKETETGVITTDRIQETFAQVQGNREKARERKQRNLEKVLKRSAELKESSGEPNNRSKVKESKVKVYKRLKEELSIYLDEKIIESNLSPFQEKIIEFFNFRMNKPAAEKYQSTKGIDGLIRNVVALVSKNYPVNQCIDIAMEAKGGAGWQTPNPSYYDSYDFSKKTTPRNGRSEKNAQACQDFING